MSNTKIEWATKVWNPVRGCSKVSEGCRNCYAIKQAHRFAGDGLPFEGLTVKTAAGVNWTGRVTLVNDMLLEPLKWRKHERIFVNSMSDLFHPEVPDSFIDKVFGVMLACKVLENKQDHSFMMLTKRPERMKKYMEDGAYELLKRWSNAWNGIIHVDNGDMWFSEYVLDLAVHQELFPLPNVWLGVSVENQKAADERIPLLIQTPAVVKFLSCEPLLGPVNLSKWLLTPGWVPSYYDPDNIHSHPNVEPTNEHIQWVIVGGESGHKARPMHPDWARSLRDQCQAAGTSFFFKQWGEWAPESNFTDYIPSGKSYEFANETVWRVGKHAAGRLLDGVEWNELPNQI